MTFEVTQPVGQPVVIGSVANVIVIRDVRDQQPNVRPGETVNLVVTTTTSGLVQGRATVVQKPSGRALHLAFTCPSCAQVAFKLYPAFGGGLACRVCARHRSRRQRERTTRAWRAGGEQEDALLRALGKGGPVGRALPGHLHQGVDELHHADLQRLASLRFLPSASGQVEVSGSSESPYARDGLEEWFGDAEESCDGVFHPLQRGGGYMDMTPTEHSALFDPPDKPTRLHLGSPVMKPPVKGGFIESLAKLIFELEDADHESRS